MFYPYERINPFESPAFYPFWNRCWILCRFTHTDSMAHFHCCDQHLDSFLFGFSSCDIIYPCIWMVIYYCLCLLYYIYGNVNSYWWYQTELRRRTTLKNLHETGTNARYIVRQRSEEQIIQRITTKFAQLFHEVWRKIQGRHTRKHWRGIRQRDVGNIRRRKRVRRKIWSQNRRIDIIVDIQKKKEPGQISESGTIKSRYNRGRTQKELRPAIALNKVPNPPLVSY